MLRQIRAWIVPSLEVSIQPNRVSGRRVDSGKSTMIEAPFSCSHLLAQDIDILEHACQQLFRQALSRSWFSFPRVEVSIPGRLIHSLERRVIENALSNAGASRVTFNPAVRICDEQSAAQAAYVAMANRRR